MNGIDAVAWKIGEASLKGILLEIGSYPKPGLVDPLSAGSHTDMNFLTFMTSSATIAPALYLIAQAGRNHKNEPAELFPEIRKIGRLYEEELLDATNGVNTQRGILFSAGVLCGAAGYVSQSSETFSAEHIFKTTSEMTHGLSDRELTPDKRNTKRIQTAGEKLFIKYGTRGIRGEVEDGFPSVKNVGLPQFAMAVRSGLSLNKTLIHALISLMACVEDTTILWRKGLDGLKFVQKKAIRILESGSVFTEQGSKQIVELEETLVKQNISPGGSADLLAVTAGVYFLINKRFSGQVC